MSTTAPLAVRIGGFAARAALSTLLVALAVLAIFASSLVGPAPSANAAEDSCPSVEVVFARGTNEASGIGATGQAFVDALNARLPGQTVGVYAVNYPASLSFGQAAEGIIDATNKIESIAASCPDTKIVLGGYSQGAAVAGYAVTDTVPDGFNLPAGITGPMPAAIAPHVAAVVLFATPETWILNLVDRNAPPISVGPLYSAKTLQLCATGDPVCFPGGLDRSAHSSYKVNGMADRAADFVASQLAASTPSPAVVQQTAGDAGAPSSQLDPPLDN